MASAVGSLASAIAQGAGMAMLLSLIAIAALVIFAVRALLRRITAQTRTRSGREVPREIAPTIDALDAAHAALEQRLAG
ncbi:MAG: hypothetical protein AAFW98_16185 [Pseudomonadota bacterium]